MVSNDRYLLSLNDAALVWIKDKFQNETIYFGNMLRVEELEPHINKKPM
jgi:hypothetical protein